MRVRVREGGRERAEGQHIFSTSALRFAELSLARATHDPAGLAVPMGRQRDSGACHAMSARNKYAQVDRTHTHTRSPLSPLIKPSLPTSSGAFGFVILAQEIETGEHWAIKFLERGNKITKVRMWRESERERVGRRWALSIFSPSLSCFPLVHSTSAGS